MYEPQKCPAECHKYCGSDLPDDGFIYENKNCLIRQREVGEDTYSFSKALRSALREDPDIILVGEMRDL